jgi:uncharacterized surface protein with fasciclin (FAS1) repeats
MTAAIAHNLLFFIFLLFGTAQVAAAMGSRFKALKDGDEEPCKTILEIAQGDPNFSTLVKAVVKAGLDQDLATKNLTVFTPTNAAFQASGLDLNTTSVADLKDVLLYHMAAGEIEADYLVDGQQFKTLQGSFVTARVSIDPKDNEPDLDMLNDAHVTDDDVKACNGLVHVIDKVLNVSWTQNATTNGTTTVTNSNATGTDGNVTNTVGTDDSGNDVGDDSKIVSSGSSVNVSAAFAGGAAALVVLGAAGLMLRHKKKRNTDHVPALEQNDFMNAAPRA